MGWKGEPGGRTGRSKVQRLAAEEELGVVELGREFRVGCKEGRRDARRRGEMPQRELEGGRKRVKVGTLDPPI